MGKTIKVDTNDPYNDPFPSRLRLLLDRKGETQGKLAESIGVHRQSIGQWKDGTTVPDINALYKIAEYYNVSTDYLLGRTDFESPDIDAQAINKKIGLSDDAIYNLETLKDLSTVNPNSIELGNVSDCVDDSKMLLKVINFLLGSKESSEGTLCYSHLSIAGQFLRTLGMYLFAEFESANSLIFQGDYMDSKSKEIVSKEIETKNCVILVDKKTKHSTVLPISTIKQSLLSEMMFQLQKWEEDIRTNREK
jgi:transcriptional regulator with XRE-family HTH domain